MKASCCSLRLISRIRNVVFRTTPKISTTKKIIPKTSSATSRQLSRIQPTFNAIANATRHAPSVMKKATDLRRRGLTRMAAIVPIIQLSQSLRQANGSAQKQHQPHHTSESGHQTTDDCQLSRIDVIQRPAR